MRYQDCPECGERTSFMYTASPIPEDEAIRRKRTAEFEEYLTETGRG